MDVAFYHDDPSNRLATTVYDPQSSPGSVDSISSTDAGPVCAIGAARFERFDRDFAKSASVKAMNLQVQSGNVSYPSAQHLVYSQATEPVVSREEYQSPDPSFNEPPARTTPPQSFSVNFPESTPVSTVPISTPEVINMLKVGGSEFDQVMTQYNQNAGPTQNFRNAGPDNMFMQDYSNDLTRQQTHGGSNPDVSNPATTSHQSVATSSSVLLNQSSYVSPEFYYNRDQSDIPSSSGYGSPAATMHHHAANPGLQQGQILSMSPLPSGMGQLKDELPQTVPISTKQTMSPINMEEQEVIKTERKRMRNRLAASKCRKRKLERISRLEDKVNNLKQQNLDLSSNANLLRQQVADLKSKVMAHVNSGCQVMMSQQQLAF